MTTLARTSAGMLYQSGFSSLSGWANDGGWSSAADPALVTFGALPAAFYARPFTATRHDRMGSREAMPLIEGGVWYLLYDGGTGDGVTGDRQYWAMSYDRGRSWSPQGVFGPGLVNGAGGSFPAIATGWLEKRGSLYYLHRVTAAGNFEDVGLPDVGLPLGPYQWDIWSAPAMSGPWTWVRNIASETGTWANSDKYPGCVIKNGSSYYAFMGGTGTDVLAHAGISTAQANPDAAFLISGSAITSEIENPKVFYHPALSRWVMLANRIAPGSRDHTDANLILVSTSLTDWSGATPLLTQSADAPIDGSLHAIGFACHLTGPDGALIYDAPTGIVPIVYDGNASRWDTGWHRGRQILGTVLEPSPSCARFAASDGVDRYLARSLAHTDFEAEFIVRFSADVPGGGANNVGLCFRRTDANNQYRLICRNGGYLLLDKQVGGVYTPLSADGPGITPVADRFYRIRVKALGTSIKAWIDGQLQVNVTDSDLSSGTEIAMIGASTDAGINCDVRLLSIRAGQTLSVSGLTPGIEAILRAYGGLFAGAAIANASAEATFTLTHGPYAALEVEGADYSVSGGIWPGDVLEFTGMSAEAVRPTLRLVAPAGAGI